jgi:phosphoribosylamine--glycine ligase
MEAGGFIADTTGRCGKRQMRGAMRILLVGNGGREHAIASALSRSPEVAKLFVAPGNGGTKALAKTENIPISAGETAQLVDFAAVQAVDLTVVGPEAPLVAGIADAFHAAGLPVFGPSQAAAQLEGSKAFSKQFMQRHGIPSGRAEIFQDVDAATAYLDGLDDVPVIKASGLAAGKGVILPETKQAARDTLHAIMVDRQFGAAGDTVLIEERLSGPEVSVLAFCDGESVQVMPAAQDHKRLLDGDRGPNTGGMGAFAPAPLATPELLETALHDILMPTVQGLAVEGTPYVGVLYAGLMLTADGPKVLEFNCRFGDPETQVILPLLESDLLEVMLACVEGRLAELSLQWRDGAAATIVAASAGYPGEYVTGKPIIGAENAEAQGCLVFHAGTTWDGGTLRTAGGRVLAVTGMGADLRAAVEKAYAGIGEIRFDGVQYRTDIGRDAAGI